MYLSGVIHVELPNDGTQRSAIPSLPINLSQPAALRCLGFVFRKRPTNPIFHRGVIVATIRSVKGAVSWHDGIPSASVTGSG